MRMLSVFMVIYVIVGVSVNILMWMWMFVFMVMGKPKSVSHGMFFIREGIKPSIIGILFAVKEFYIRFNV